MIQQLLDNHEAVLRGLAVFMIGLVVGAVHSIWSLHTYIPILTEFWVSVRAQLGKKVTPPKKSDIKWFLTSLFSVSSAASVAAHAIDGMRGLALYFVGLCFCLVPFLAAILFALIALVVLIIYGN